jgi:hypothetical protein
VADEDGNTQFLNKPKIAPSTSKQRNRALEKRTSEFGLVTFPRRVEHTHTHKIAPSPGPVTLADFGGHVNFILKNHLRLQRKSDPKHVCADHNHVWVDLCRGSSIAIQQCKTFLELHVKRKRLTLGPEEFIIEPAIKSSRSLNAFWKSLIAGADAEVLLYATEPG